MCNFHTLLSIFQLNELRYISVHLPPPSDSKGSEEVLVIAYGQKLAQLTKRASTVHPTHPLLDGIIEDMTECPGFAKRADCHVYTCGCNCGNRSIRHRCSMVDFRVEGLSNVPSFLAEPQSTTVSSNETIGFDKIAFCFDKSLFELGCARLGSIFRPLKDRIWLV